MARIKITDLPRDMKISREELRMARGGAFEFYLPAPRLAVLKKAPRTIESPLRGLYPKVE